MLLVFMMVISGCQNTDEQLQEIDQLKAEVEDLKTEVEESKKVYHELTDEEKFGKEMAIKRIEEKLEKFMSLGKDQSTCERMIKVIEEKIKLFKEKYNYEVDSPYSGLSYDEAYEYFQQNRSE